MSHFYDCSKKVALLSQSTTPPQARKANHYPSVTTILGILKSDFVDNIWKPRKIVELARENPELDSGAISELTYGQYPHPETEKMIASSEFGTQVHARIEELVLAMRDGFGVDYNPFNAWAEPFLVWLEDNNVEVLNAEEVVYSHRMRIAGSVDFIGEMDGKIFLADYKCRSCKGSGKGKFYDKDCSQLSIESWMYARMYGLDYLPAVRSICIDVDTKQHIHKEWSELDMYKGILRAKLLATVYWMDWMSEDVGKLKNEKIEIINDEIAMTCQILNDLKEVNNEQ
jgi:hypothetical protein